MGKDILATPKGKVVTLADGKEYTLSPFNLNTLANLEETFNCDLGELKGKLTGRTATAFRKLIHVLLMENYPDLTLTDVGSLILMSALKEIMPSLTEALSKLET